MMIMSKVRRTSATQDLEEGRQDSHADCTYAHVAVVTLDQPINMVWIQTAFFLNSMRHLSSHAFAT